MENTGNNERDLIQLDDLLRAAQDEQADIRRVEQRVAKLLTEVAFAEFPALKNMTAPQIRAFGNTVTRTAAEFALQAAHLAYEAEKES